MDYRTYRLSMKEEGCCLAISIVLSAVAAWILYRQVWGVVSFLVIFPMCRRNQKEQSLRQRNKKLLLQFVDAMQSVVTALLSGYSIEGAWKEAEAELEELYGKEADMVRELHQINGAVAMNQSIENLLYQFAMRSGLEDVIDFAEVFLFAKRSGGNFAVIIKNTILHIREKMNVEQEIETVLAGKKMEQKVMNTVPVLLLAYLNLTAEEFLEPLYHNAFGVCIMSLAFVAYLGAFFWSKKMMDIRP